MSILELQKELVENTCRKNPIFKLEDDDSLIKLGFINSKNYNKQSYHTFTNNDLEKIAINELINLNNNNIFKEKDLVKIFKKHGLHFDDVEYFTDEIPEDNLKIIKNHHDKFYSEFPTKLFYEKYNKNYSESCIGISKFLHGYKIAAPSFMFTESRHKELSKIKDDPIVFAKWRISGSSSSFRNSIGDFFYELITMWGAEQVISEFQQYKLN